MNMTIPISNIISDILGPLISALDWVLVQIHSVVGSWGLSIIFLTILVRALLIPLTLKQIRSMQAMQRMQPEIKAIQAKYKGDKQKLNEELMRFYKENEINPLGSCRWSPNFQCSSRSFTCFDRTLRLISAQA